ncbi:MAG: ATP-binding cassette domain-containing protein [Gammaproteobacteria bacterium]|nr:MAG: ATP-binding cassette domain-containing protein [Gammaproteobacteria bacterium]
MIEVQHLRKSFGEVHAVKDVSFTARDGHITGLLGPNGAGKTTTLRMLYGLLVPDEGTIRIDGHDPLTDIQAVQRSIGVLPDNRGLYKRLTARENIRYFGALHGLEGARLESRIDELVQDLDLTDFIDRRTEGFSHGERVKVAIARALVHGPRTLMLDEPTNGLDVMSTRAMRRFLLNLKDAGHCVLFSSHIMQEVTALCDRIVVIAHGRVVAAGTPDQLRSATGQDNLEDAFVKVIGSGEGLLA